ncbi:DUF1835 domain-containing protein [Paenibacillus sp. HJL G12]|uniref:DUF1835 domain-containing protein n=1 Tax=Paenibacillus dendrobii TaxID=2691084 RepID=A0A7X3LEW7_9BACL|nr:DUF1835 domain-containing protein [Paenibacillus dendrobii]MWV42427.1 DUF1835 domain-containing protein [Paenibacillus dendrobii]
MESRKNRLAKLDSHYAIPVLMELVEQAEQSARTVKQYDLADSMLRYMDRYLNQVQEIKDLLTHVHVAFNCSAAGSLKVARSTVGQNASSNVLAWEDNFSYGPIFRIHNHESYLERQNWLSGHIVGERFPFVSLEHQMLHIMKQLNGIPDHLRIYLWSGNNAHEQVSLRLALYALRGKLNDVHIVNVSQIYTEIDHHFDTEPLSLNQVPLEALQEMLKEIASLPPIDEQTKNMLIKEWEILSETTGTLRTWEDGKIVDLEENAFDEAILQTIRMLQKENQEQGGDGFVKAHILLGRLFERKLCDSFQYLEYRIWHLIDSGLLEHKGLPTNYSMYSVRLRDM